MTQTTTNYRNVIPGIATAVASGSAQLINGTVRNLFQNKVFKSQADKIRLEGRLAQLNSAQQYALALRLQDATNDNERFAILQDAVSQIDVATVQSNAEILKSAIQARANETRTTAIIIGSAVVLIIAAYYIIYKR